MSRRILDFTVVFVAAFLSILAFEGITRLFGLTPSASGFYSKDDASGWSEPHPELGWVNKPGTWRSVEQGHARMTFLADGSRMSPLLAGKQAAPFKVFVVGCSFTQGYGVSDDETYVHFLNERFPQIRFENFGTGGYNTVQATMMAERVINATDPASQPDLVIYALLSDHVRRNVSSGNFMVSLTDAAGRYISPPHARLAGEDIRLAPFRAIEPWPLERQSVLVTLLHKVWIKFGYERSGSEAEAVTRRLVERFDQTIRAHDTRPLVVVLKRDRPLSDLVRPGSVEVLDCSHPEYGRDPDLRTGGTTGHPSAKLHEYYADCIARWIDARMADLGG